MNNYKMLKENDDHFVMHDTKDGRQFKVAKKGLTKAHQEKVRHMYAAGIVGAPNGQFAPPPSNLGDLYNAATATPPPQEVILPQESANFATADELDQLAKKLPKGPREGQTEVLPTPVNPNAHSAADQSSGIKKVDYQPDAGMAMNKVAQDNENLATKAKSDIEKSAGLYQQAAAQSQKAAADYQKQIGDLQNGAKQQRTALDTERNQLQQDIETQKIDPHRIWNNASTGNKVLAGIGVLLSGIGSGLTGQKNLAVEVLNKAVDDDIAAQKSELGKKENLLSKNIQKYGDLNSATLATAAQLNSVLQAQVTGAAGKMNNAQAQQQAGLFNYQIDQKINDMHNQLAQRNAFMQPSNRPGLDLSKINSAISMGMIKPEDARTELGEYRKMEKIQKSINEAFDQVAELQKASSRFGDPIQSRAKIKKIVGSMAAKMAKDDAGRVTETDLPIFENLFQGYLDDPSTANVGRQQALKLGTDKYSFPGFELAGIYREPQEETPGSAPKPVGSATLTNYRP